MKSFFPLVFVCAALASLFCSCTEHLLAKIPKTEFASETLQPWNAPFEGLWVNPKVQGKEKHYTRLYIAPTTIDYLTPEAGHHWHPEEFKAQAVKLAESLTGNSGKIWPHNQDFPSPWRTAVKKPTWYWRRPLSASTAPWWASIFCPWGHPFLFQGFPTAWG